VKSIALATALAAVTATPVAAADSAQDARRAVEAASKDARFLKAVVNHDDRAMTQMVARASKSSHYVVVSSGGPAQFRICLGKHGGAPCFKITIAISVE
jgi:hypothetical protein